MERLKTIGYAASHLTAAIIWGIPHMSVCGACWMKQQRPDDAYGRVCRFLDFVFGEDHCRDSYWYCMEL